MDWDIAGHHREVEILTREIASENIRHAYLICGQQGLGRRTLALRLAQSLNCPNPPSSGDACRECRTCRQIEKMAYPDLSIIEAGHIGGTLRVDQVRELLRSLALMPYEAKYRVAILLRFEEAHLSAMNALLKTLEEPAPRAVIIITAESPESLLPTISSRCEILRLHPVPTIELSQYLQQKEELDLQTADMIARLSEGRPGLAIRMVHQPDVLENRKLWIELHHKLLVSSRRERFSMVENIYIDREAVRAGLSIWLSLWHDVLLVSLGVNSSVINLDLEEEIRHLAKQFGKAGSVERILRIEKFIKLIDSNINQRLALEVLALDLPGAE